MGMVVLSNYAHVMTILPSAILVNEIYVIPFQRKCVIWWNSKISSNYLNDQNSKKVSDKNTDDEYAEEGLSQCSFEGDEKLESAFEKVSEMSRLDRYLVGTHANFVNKRPYHLLIFASILTLVLGISGIANFHTSDGKIVLFSNKYNLGRVPVINDLYFNDDISKSIEEDGGVKDGGVSIITIDEDTSSVIDEIEPEAPLQAFIDNTSEADTNKDYKPQDGTAQVATMSFGVKPVETESASQEDASQPVSDKSEASQPVFDNDVNQASNNGSVLLSSPTTVSNTHDFGSILVKSPSTLPELFGEESGVALRRRETIFVNLIWGVEPAYTVSSIWFIEKVPKSRSLPSSSTFDLAEPPIQEWLLKCVETAKSDSSLYIRGTLTWIEILRDFAIDAGVGFPIPKHLFTGYLQLLKEEDAKFANLIRNEIGTNAPGLAGQYTFASITLMADAVQIGVDSLSEKVYKQWNEFTEKMNKSSPSKAGEFFAQSKISLDAYRIESIIDSTLTSWFVANGVCLLVILLFIQNVALSLMVMMTIVLILFCLGGLLFAILRMPFGPIEALGVSIFVGLSANYSLHVVHAYHHSKSNDRSNKIKEAIFAVGSPIVASAFSTMGACAFLFCCRTWVFIELGILICSITAMALLFSMLFLFAWLAIVGPLSLDPHSNNRLHRWDLKLLRWIPCLKIFTSNNDNTEIDGSKLSDSMSSSHSSNEESENSETGYSVDVIKDDDEEGRKLKAKYKLKDAVIVKVSWWE